MVFNWLIIRIFCNVRTLLGALAELIRFDYERVAGTWLYRVSSTAPMVTILDFATHPSRGNLLGHGLDHPDEREHRDWHALGVGA